MMQRRHLLVTLVSLAPAAALMGCQAQPNALAAPGPVVFVAPGGVGSIFLNAPILPQTRTLLRQDIDGLVNAGATTIRLAIRSPGGDLDAAQGIVSDIDTISTTRGISFETYATGLVASAATYVFLSGQRRYAANGSGFLFHAAGMVSTGAVSAERLREGATKIEAYEQAVRALLKARTRLNDAAIDVYLHRTVILNADDARRDGVVDGINGFPTPPGGRIITIAARAPTAGASAPAPAPAVNGR